MDDLGSIVGILSGLVAIFTFVTGINSLGEIRRARRHPEPADASIPAARPALLRLLVLVPVFLVSIAVTAAMGMQGSDTGGIVALLLGAAAIAVLAFDLFLYRAVPPGAFGLVTAGVIAALGWWFGTMARGEEAFGLGVGAAIGAGAWLIIALTNPAARRPAAQPVPAAAPRTASSDDARHERTILTIASRQQGRVRIPDVAMGSDIPLDEAARLLESLAERGYCTRETSPSGAVVYRFHDLEPL